jgi:ArsR family transcriptional regulator, cadmium/lead-responsive transcriptional repressor
MSNHLACLRGCGLVVAIPEGRRTRYELTDARIGHALGDLLDLVLVVDPDCCGGENPPALPELTSVDTVAGEVVQA